MRMGPPADKRYRVSQVREGLPPREGTKKGRPLVIDLPMGRSVRTCGIHLSLIRCSIQFVIEESKQTKKTFLLDSDLLQSIICFYPSLDGIEANVALYQDVRDG